EDGIRDFHVTGVQTCALPISKSDEINDAINALNKRIAGLKVANGSESLWKSYEDYFEMGNIYSGSGNLDSNNIRGMLTSTHFNTLTAENHMKPDNLSSGGAGQKGTFNIFPGSNHVSDQLDRKSTRLNSSHVKISYAVFCLKKKKKKREIKQCVLRMTNFK